MAKSEADAPSPKQQAKGEAGSARTEPTERGSAEDQPILAGKTVGRYRLVLPIGAGGMAQVWAAVPQTGGIGRAVAIKLVTPEFSCDPEYERMFLDEAMVASAIRHPNVCEIRELGRDGDRLFMVLELVAGDSLTGLIQRGAEFHPLPDEIAARIIAEACAGLHAAHEALGPDGHPLGIVHRDVSPPNILVSTHGHVKVSDFGIAKARYQLHSRTRTGEIKGKFAYIPPEQILGRGVDRRADVYALGCVLYVATLGLRPFGSGPSALGKIVHGKYVHPREVRPNFPEGLEAIIARALAPKPAERFQTADEMRHELEAWLMAEGRLVMDGDVSAIVNQRLSPQRRAVIEATTNTGRNLPHALAKELLAPRGTGEAPTANSQVIFSPPPPKGPPPERRDSDTVRDDSESSPTWRPPERTGRTQPKEGVKLQVAAGIRESVPDPDDAEVTHTLREKPKVPRPSDPPNRQMPPPKPKR
jgi:serine/threonine protein kinase